MAFFEDLDLAAGAVKVAAIVLVIACVIVVNAVIRVTLRILTRRAVRRALRGSGRWKVRLARINDGSNAEQRRVQRADAAAHMLSRLSNLIVAALAALIISRILGVDPVVLLSSAGFIGAGIAIGGQALIKDWLTGLLVLLEDRYAVGDQVIMRVGANEIEGTVETLGGAGLRLRLDDGTTWHAGHGSIETVVNLSQQLIRHSVEISSDVWAELDETLIGRQLNAASHDLGLTDVLLLSDIGAEQTPSGTTNVVFHASRQLSERQRQLVAERITGAAESPSPLLDGSPARHPPTQGLPAE